MPGQTHIGSIKTGTTRHALYQVLALAMRTGSTYLDGMIASHPCVTSMGERSPLKASIGSNVSQNQSLALLEAMEATLIKHEGEVLQAYLTGTWRPGVFSIPAKYLLTPDVLRLRQQHLCDVRLVGGKWPLRITDSDAANLQITSQG